MSTQSNTREQYPVLPTRSIVLLPGVTTPVEVGRGASVQAVDAAEHGERLILVVPQKDPDVRAPGVDDLYEIGVLAEVVQITRHDARRYTVTLRTRERRRIEYYSDTEPYLTAVTTPFAEMPGDPQVVEELMRAIKEPLSGVVAERADDPDAAREQVEALDDPDMVVGLAASSIEMPRDTQLALLSEANVVDRLRAVLPGVVRLDQVLTIKADIDAQLAGTISRDQRERVLRDRMRAIKEELGEEDMEADLDEYRERISASKMPEEVRAAAKRQIGRMSHMASSSPEYNVARTYLETLLDIPWGIYTDDILDVPAARVILDADHSGLEKVKKRILEFIAVRKLAPDKHGPILCLVGPPGVGKTSLGRSIASALGRKYVRTALGGVRDEAEIRGHRRTYIGALPGRIANALKKAGSMNPVLVLDELDKLSADHRGDPSSALLEVLDPEQNKAFSDHYLEVDLDLSRVMFIATANQLDTIPAPLLDRLEVIELPGYTLEEKRVIARKHLLPKQIAEHGLGRDQIEIEPDALDVVIAHYTREAGVRNLEREIAALCRHAAVAVASGETESVRVVADSVEDVLGPPRFISEIAERKPEVGVCTGLAWTPTGGDILFVEARAMPGRGELKITGQLGGIMSESATAAMSWVRANAERLGLDPERIAAIDIHLHLPSGAIKKDGPSAGVAISVVLVSLLSGRPVRNDVAITGEVTLRGLVLPVGGIKEKVLAAHRAGIRTVLLPERNRKDLEDIPQDIRNELAIHFVQRVDEALAIAMGDMAADASSMPQPFLNVPLPVAQSEPSEQSLASLR